MVVPEPDCVCYEKGTVMFSQAAHAEDLFRLISAITSSVVMLPSVSVSCRLFLRPA
jgi:hypothetical protein